MNANDIRYRFFKSDVSKIFFITVGIFVFTLMIKVYFQLNDYKADWFASTFYPYFSLNSTVAGSLRHLWVLVVHFCFEENIGVLFSNILWLYFFGLILEDIRGTNSLLSLYFFAGFVSGICILACIALIPHSLPTGFYYGMRAPIMAIVAATVATNPQRRVFEALNGGIPIYVLGILYTLLTVVSSMQLGAAPLMGLLVAIGIGIWYHYGLDLLLLRAQDELTTLINGDKKKTFKNKIKPTQNLGFTVKEVSQQKIDELLDKINISGYNSLSAQEKQWLENYSKK